MGWKVNGVPAKLNHKLKTSRTLVKVEPAEYGMKLSAFRRFLANRMALG
jgi:hypothetical protein